MCDVRQLAQKVRTQVFFGSVRIWVFLGKGLSKTRTRGGN
jgi:hypothetical protein